METKWCPRCEQDQPIGDFYKNKARSDGLSGFCVTCQRAANKLNSERLRAELLALLGNVCCRCGFADARALQVDHVKGGGGLEFASGVWASGRAFVERVRRNPGSYQLLCANCNWIKKHEQNETVGNRVYKRESPTKRLQGIGKGNAPAQKDALARARTTDHQRAAAKASWADPEVRASRIAKQRAVSTGRKLIDGHWVRPK